MSAACPAPIFSEQALDELSDDVRAGRGCIATFAGPTGVSAWVEVLGPKGMRPHGDALVAPVPTLRLWVADQPSAPLAEAAANRDFDQGLEAIETQARRHLPDLQASSLSNMLRVVKKAAARRRPRVPKVGDRLTQEGSPSLLGWASCLTLGDLQAAVEKSVA